MKEIDKLNKDLNRKLITIGLLYVSALIVGIVRYKEPAAILGWVMIITPIHLLAIIIHQFIAIHKLNKLINNDNSI